MANDEQSSPPPQQMPKSELEEHEATFNAFIKVAAIVAVISVAILVFLAFVGT